MNAHVVSEDGDSNIWREESIAIVDKDGEFNRAKHTALREAVGDAGMGGERIVAAGLDHPIPK